MKKILLMGVGLAAACTMNQPQDPRAEQSGEAKLAAALRGFEQSGPPVSCVQMRDLGSNHSAGENALIFDGMTGSTLYVNRPPAGCPASDFGRALVFRTNQTQLCRGDVADVVDTLSGTSYGGCALGDFTPYRRVSR